VDLLLTCCDKVHEICEQTRRASCGDCWHSGPNCCTAVIYLHTAVHRLWLTSPWLRRCLRSPSCVARRAVARLARAGKSRHAYRPRRGRKQRPTVPCSGMRTVDRHAAGLLAGAEAAFRARARACARQASFPQYYSTCCNTALRQKKGLPCSGGPQFRCAHRPPACRNYLR
jgi:hypothetical protein